MRHKLKVSPQVKDGRMYVCKMPVFLCDKVGSTWQFWCPFCLKYHTHGAVRGHRVAHCIAQNSPFIETGYILESRQKIKT